METSVSKFFEKVKDPRIERKKLYPLAEILLVALCCIISDGEGFDDMKLYGEEKLDFLRKFYPFENGIASEDTFSRVFQLICPNTFSRCFVEWIKDFQSRSKKGIAIDGKLARRSSSEKQKALHMVSAFAHKEGLVLAQQPVSDKSNEITAIPYLLEVLDIKGKVLTIDAMGCAPKNLAVMRHTSINLIKLDSSKGSIKGKRKRAGWTDTYMEHLLNLKIC